MKVSRENVVKIMVLLDYHAAPNWNRKKTRRQLGKIIDAAIEDTEFEIEDEKLNELFQQMVQAKKDDMEIEIINGVVEEEPEEKAEEQPELEPEQVEETPVETELELEPEDESEGEPVLPPEDKNEPDDDGFLEDEDEPIEDDKSEDNEEDDWDTPDESEEKVQAPVEETPVEQEPEKKRGRPKGSKNKKKREQVDAVDKIEKLTKERKRGFPGPKIGDGNHVGIRSYHNRFFSCGLALKQCGLEDGLTDEIIQVADSACKTPNINATAGQLCIAWHVVNGFLNGKIEEKE